jgi:hypothetical protein
MTKPSNVIDTAPCGTEVARPFLFSHRKVPQFSLGGFELRTSSIPAVSCGMWHNGALASCTTKMALMVW